MLTLKVNGTERNIDAPLDKPLLWVLRDECDLPGAKFGCGFGICGACTVHIDGEAEQSCVIPVGDVLGKDIVTIEGLNDDTGCLLKERWVEACVPQCGYCQPGFIMSAAALLNRDTDIDDEAIAELPNICRCGTYQRVKLAISKAAEKKLAREVK